MAIKLSNEELQNTETGCHPGSFSLRRGTTPRTEVKSRHYSKRAGDVIPGVVVYLRHLHLDSSWVGRVQWAHKWTAPQTSYFLLNLSRIYSREC